MIKQRYLAELGQLLIFMTSADRSLTLRRFGELFDQAGPEGEQSLAERIGTPTQNAIRLSRSYEPGHITEEMLFPAGLAESAADISPEGAAPSPVSELVPSSPEAEPAVEETASPALNPAFLEIEEEFPDYSPPDLSELEEIGLVAPREADAAPEETSTFAKEAEEPAEAKEESAPASEPEEDYPEQDLPEEKPEEPRVPEEAAAPKSAASAKRPSAASAGRNPSVRTAEPPAPAPIRQPAPENIHRNHPPTRKGPPAGAPPKKAPVPQRPMPLWVGIPLLTVALLALGLPLLGIFLVLAVLLLIPGAAVLAGAVLAGIGGLWCLQYVADAALMFGLAVFLLGVGLLVLWGGFAADVSFARLYIRFLGGLKHLFLGGVVK